MGHGIHALAQQAQSHHCLVNFPLPAIDHSALQRRWWTTASTLPAHPAAIQHANILLPTFCCSAHLSVYCVAEKMVDHGIHSLAIKDMAGLLKPRAATMLVRSLASISVPCRFDWCLGCLVAGFGWRACSSPADNLLL